MVPGHGLKFVGGTLVVPPFECAWLTGEDFVLRGATACICFEAKADTDVTIILKAAPGARRWQPLQHAGRGSSAEQHASTSGRDAASPLLHPSQPQPQPASTPKVEPNYTVIMGSHRNSCLKFEKNGTTTCTVRGVPGARVSGKEFQRYWVHYTNGCIAVGTGEPSLETLSYRWS